MSIQRIGPLSSYDSWKLASPYEKTRNFDEVEDIPCGDDYDEDYDITSNIAMRIRDKSYSHNGNHSVVMEMNKIPNHVID